MGLSLIESLVFEISPDDGTMAVRPPFRLALKKRLSKMYIHRTAIPLAKEMLCVFLLHQADGKERRAPAVQHQLTGKLP